MSSRIRVRIVVLVLLWVLPWSGLLHARKARHETDELPPLEQVLGRLARVASLYRDNALRFTCNETIYYSGRDAPSVFKFTYIYRYSAETDVLTDYRVPRGRAGDKPEEELERIALEHYGLPEYLVRAYSWVFLFEEKNRPFYSYRLLGRERWNGTPAILVRFEPLESFASDPDKWYGTAWVDRQTYQVLHVEAIEAEQYDQYRIIQRKRTEVRKDSPKTYHGSFTYSTCSTDFDVVKHGMRFPGRNVIERIRYHVYGGEGKGSLREEPVFKVTQTYGGYRFFSVRTEEHIRATVSAD